VITQIPLIVGGKPNENFESCQNCRHLSDWGEEPYPYMGCDKFSHYNNLVSFPFKKKMKCFEANIWCTEFADQLDMSDEGIENDEVNKKVYYEFHKKYSQKDTIDKLNETLYEKMPIPGGTIYGSDAKLIINGEEIKIDQENLNTIWKDPIKSEI